MTVKSRPFSRVRKSHSILKCQYNCIDKCKALHHPVRMVQRPKTEQLQIRLSREEKQAIKRLAAKGGESVSRWVLKTLLPRGGLEFQAIISRLGRGESESHTISALNDFLTSLSRVEFKGAVKEAPRSKLPTLWANHIAAMVEQRAHQLGLNAPGWLNEVEPLWEPYFGTELQSLRPYLLSVSPPPFRRRNIFIDSSVGDRV
ncbi:MAG: hypothetical protein ACC661_02000 [Verrucomicrobiales bacterium]